MENNNLYTILTTFHIILLVPISYKDEILQLQIYFIKHLFFLYITKLQFLWHDNLQFIFMGGCDMFYNLFLLLFFHRLLYTGRPTISAIHDPIEDDLFSIPYFVCHMYSNAHSCIKYALILK